MSFEIKMDFEKMKYKIEPPHDKTNKTDVQPAKTQISPGVHSAWSVFALRSMDR